MIGEKDVHVGSAQLDKPKKRNLNKFTARRQLTKANNLIKEAKELSQGERKCNGWVKVKDEAGNPVLGEDGKPVRRPCKRPPLLGSTVCYVHGGRLPNVKKKAQQRMKAMLDPAVVRLEYLAHQNEHMPTALGAVKEIINRGLGVVGSAGDGKDGRPQILIGIKVGGIETPVGVTVANRQITAGDGGVEDGEVVGGDEE